MAYILTVAVVVVIVLAVMGLLGVMIDRRGEPRRSDLDTNARL